MSERPKHPAAPEPTRTPPPDRSWAVDFDDPSVVNVAALPDGSLCVTTSRVPKHDVKGGVPLDGPLDPYGYVPPPAMCSLHVFDAHGREQFVRPGAVVAAVLSDGALLAIDEQGVFRWNGPDQDDGARFDSSGIEAVRARAGRIVISARWRWRSVVLDEGLAALGETPLSPWDGIGPDGGYVAEHGRVWRTDWRCRREPVAEIPLAAIAEEVRTAYFRQAWKMPKGDLSIAHPDSRERSGGAWIPNPAADPALIFLCNRLPGFTVVALDRRTGRHWVRCLSPGCCGQFVQRLSDGTFVASSGCGGSLTWLDRDGAILGQQDVPKNAPDEPDGPVSRVIESQLQIGSGDVIYAARFGAVFAYGADRQLRWFLPPGLHDKAYADPFRARLVRFGDSKDGQGAPRGHVEVFDNPQ